MFLAATGMTRRSLNVSLWDTEADFDRYLEKQARHEPTNFIVVRRHLTLEQALELMGGKQERVHGFSLLPLPELAHLRSELDRFETDRARRLSWR